MNVSMVHCCCSTASTFARVLSWMVDVMIYQVTIFLQHSILTQKAPVYIHAGSISHGVACCVPWFRRTPWISKSVYQVGLPLYTRSVCPCIPGARYVVPSPYRDGSAQGRRATCIQSSLVQQQCQVYALTHLQPQSRFGDKLLEI